MPRIDVQIEGLPRLIRKLGPDRVRQPIERFLERAAATGERAVEAESPSATVRAGITHRREGQQGHVKGPDLATFLNSGTRAHMPPVAALEGWAAAHGVDPFVVARSIARKGTKRRRFIQRAVRKARGDIRGLVDQMGAEIRRLWESG